MSQRRRKGGGAAEALPPPPPPPPVAAGALCAGGAAAVSARDASEAPSDALVRDCQTALSGTKRNVTKALKRAKALVAEHPSCSLAHRTLVLTHLTVAEDLSGAAEKKEYAAAVEAANAAVEACPRCLHCRYARVHALYSLAESMAESVADSAASVEAFREVVKAAEAERRASEAQPLRVLQCGEPALEQEVSFFLEKTGPAAWKAVYNLQLLRCARARRENCSNPCALCARVSVRAHGSA
jgi:hypothetical protein